MRVLLGFVGALAIALFFSLASFDVDAKSLAWWNTQSRGWEVVAAPVELEVGASSADIRLRQTITVTR